MNRLFQTIKTKFRKLSPLKKIISILLVLLLILGIVLTIKTLISQYSVHKSYNVKRQEILDIDDIVGYENIGDDILVYSNSEMMLTNSYGESLWRYSYDMLSPRVIKSENYCAVIDIDKSSVVVFRRDKVISSFRTNGNIMSGCISTNGVIALIEKVSSNSRINMYDSKGKLLVRNKLGGGLNKYPFGIAVSSDGTKLYVSYVSINNTNSTIFDVFDFGTKNYSKSNKLIYEKKFNGLFVTDILTLGDNKLVLVGDSQNIFYEMNKSCKIIKKVKNKTNLISATNTKDKLIIVSSVDKGKALYRLMIYNDEGELTDTNYINRNFDYINISNDKIILFSQFEGTIFSDNARLIFDGTFEDEIEYVSTLDGINKYLMLNKTNIMEVKLD